HKHTPDACLQYAYVYILRDVYIVKMMCLIKHTEDMHLETIIRSQRDDNNTHKLQQTSIHNVTDPSLLHLVIVSTNLLSPSTYLNSSLLYFFPAQIIFQRPHSECQHFQDLSYSCFMFRFRITLQASPVLTILS